MNLEQKVNKGFDAHDALLVGSFGTIGYLTGGIIGTAIGVGIGYLAGQLADSSHYSLKYSQK